MPIIVVVYRMGQQILPKLMCCILLFCPHELNHLWSPSPSPSPSPPFFTTALQFLSLKYTLQVGLCSRESNPTITNIIPNDIEWEMILKATDHVIQGILTKVMVIAEGLHHHQQLANLALEVLVRYSITAVKTLTIAITITITITIAVSHSFKILGVGRLGPSSTPSRDTMVSFLTNRIELLKSERQGDGDGLRHSNVEKWLCSSSSQYFECFLSGCTTPQTVWTTKS